MSTPSNSSPAIPSNSGQVSSSSSAVSAEQSVEQRKKEAVLRVIHAKYPNFSKDEEAIDALWNQISHEIESIRPTLVDFTRPAIPLGLVDEILHMSTGGGDTSQLSARYTKPIDFITTENRVSVNVGKGEHTDTTRITAVTATDDTDTAASTVTAAVVAADADCDGDDVIADNDDCGTAAIIMNSNSNSNSNSSGDVDNISNSNNNKNKKRRRKLLSMPTAKSRSRGGVTGSAASATDDENVDIKQEKQENIKVIGDVMGATAVAAPATTTIAAAVVPTEVNVLLSKAMELFLLEMGTEAWLCSRYCGINNYGSSDNSSCCDSNSQKTSTTTSTAAPPILKDVVAAVTDSGGFQNNVITSDHILAAVDKRDHFDFLCPVSHVWSRRRRNNANINNNTNTTTTST